MHPVQTNNWGQEAGVFHPFLPLYATSILTPPYLPPNSHGQLIQTVYTMRLHKGPPTAPVPGTAADDRDMKRMGKIQKLNVSFGVIS